MEILDLISQLHLPSSVNMLPKYLYSRQKWMVNFTSRATLSPRKNPGTHWTGGREGPRAGLQGLENVKLSCLYRDLNPESPAPSPVTIPTTKASECIHRTRTPSCTRTWKSASIWVTEKERKIRTWIIHNSTNTISQNNLTLNMRT